MREPNPLVSIVVPMYNAEAYIREALDSVFDQDYESIEVVAVDDGSTDRSVSIVRDEYRNNVRLIEQENRGVSAARNRGVEQARGALIAFQDADDVWLPGKLSFQVELLRANPQIDGCLTRMKNFLDAGATRPAWLDESLFTDGLWGTLQTLLVSRRVIDRVGGLNESLRVSKDVDWFSRAEDSGQVLVKIPQVYVMRRIHRSNISHDLKAAKRDIFRALRASIDRKREATER